MKQIAKNKGYWGVANEEQGVKGAKKAIRRLYMNYYSYGKKVSGH